MCAVKQIDSYYSLVIMRNLKKIARVQHFFHHTEKRKVHFFFLFSVNNPNQSAQRLRLGTCMQSMSSPTVIVAPLCICSQLGACLREFLFKFFVFSFYQVVSLLSFIPCLFLEVLVSQGSSVPALTANCSRAARCQRCSHLSPECFSFLAFMFTLLKAVICRQRLLYRYLTCGLVYKCVSPFSGVTPLGQQTGSTCFRSEVNPFKPIY